MLGLRPLDHIESNLPLNMLDGINLWHRARLEEEDIENVHSMATADLVDRFLSTRFPPDRLIDWVDQAMLYTALGADSKASNEANLRHKLRSAGIRTASALIYAHEKHAESMGKLLDSDSLSVLIDALRTYPNLTLVQNWRSLSPTTAKEQAETVAVAA